MKVDRQKLLDVLALVKPGLANKEILEQTTSFVFSGGRVFTYNDQIAVSHDAPLDITGAVGAKELYDLLARYTVPEVDIEVTGESLVIKARSSKSTLPLQAEISESFVKALQELGTPKTWLPLPEDFSYALAFCAFSTGKDMTKPMLTYLHVHRALVESCDDYRFTRYTMKKPGKTFAQPLFIPAAEASQLTKYEPTQVSATKGWAHFANDKGTVFSCRTAEGAYPDLSKITPKDGDSVTLPDTLGEVLLRAEVVGEKDPFGTMVDLEVSKNKVVVRAEGSAGRFEERLRATYQGEDIRIGITSEFLREMLGKLNTVTISKDRNAMRFDGEGFVHVCALTPPSK